MKLPYKYKVILECDNPNFDVYYSTNNSQAAFDFFERLLTESNFINDTYSIKLTDEYDRIMRMYQVVSN